jgi:hypothetical protein
VASIPGPGFPQKSATCAAARQGVEEQTVPNKIHEEEIAGGHVYLPEVAERQKSKGPSEIGAASGAKMGVEESPPDHQSLPPAPAAEAPKWAERARGDRQSSTVDAGDAEVLCAEEGGTCLCHGRVRYGHSKTGRWAPPQNVEAEIKCSNAVFGDPAPRTRKACFCQNPELRLEKPGGQRGGGGEEHGEEGPARYDEQASDGHGGDDVQAEEDDARASRTRSTKAKTYVSLLGEGLEEDTGVWGSDDANLKCTWAYGSGAFFDGEMCSCKPGFASVDGRCLPNGDSASYEHSHDRGHAPMRGTDSRVAVLAKTGVKAATGVVLCTVMWDATALLGNPFAVPGLVDNALCGALAGFGLFGTR